VDTVQKLFRFLDESPTCYHAAANAKAFDITKIIAAITKANESVDESIRMTPMQIQRIAESVEFSCLKMNRSPSVEEIQDLVEYQIMAHGAFEVAKNYVTYRYTRSLVRRSNTTDEKILSLIECCNEEAKQENANKNPVVNSTQRDYMAGEVSRDITERILLPQEIVEAHREGIIHFHDADYYAQHMHNCDLVNLEDMLQNGTVITGTLIERLSIGGQQRHHLILNGLNTAADLLPQTGLHQLRDLFRTGVRADGGHFRLHDLTNLLTADLHKGGQMGQGDGLAAILVGSHLCHDLGAMLQAVAKLWGLRSGCR